VAALAGVIGPIIFAAVVATLTVLQYDFMMRFGWRPLEDPGSGWPSGLALGPHGWLMNGAFVFAGVLLMVFAVGLHRGLPQGPKSGPALLFLSGLAMALLVFETDPIRRTGPRSWPGFIHDAAFVVFALALLLSLLFLWRRMNKDPLWQGHARFTLATALVCAACLVLPGVAYYVFLIVALLWIELTAFRLLRLS
jgi:hypothetical membrane protein